MREVLPENAGDYLRETGRIPLDRPARVEALGWGVSNVVLRVDVEGQPPFVLKQARERLRTKMLWVSRLERIWTERDAMALLATILPPGTVPNVLFSDEPNFLFAMTCAPDDSVVWKEQLLAGQLDPSVARLAGEVLGTIHTATRGHPALDGRLADTTVFDELRIDPFYRTIARAHPEIAPGIDALIASMAETPDPCLVLGDFSPKNFLVHSAGLTLVDFETAHAGDPAFDVGFFLSHLWLKRIHAGEARAADFDELIRAFTDAYRARTARPLPERTQAHLRACILARVDGKSPVDYLAEPERAEARGFALESFLGKPGDRDPR